MPIAKPFPLPRTSKILVYKLVREHRRCVDDPPAPAYLWRAVAAFVAPTDQNKLCGTGPAIPRYAKGSEDENMLTQASGPRNFCQSPYHLHAICEVDYNTGAVECTRTQGFDGSVAVIKSRQDVVCDGMFDATVASA